MAGLTLDGLPRPPAGYRPSLNTRREDGVVDFETLRASLAQADERARRLLVSMDALSEAEAVHASDLYQRLIETVQTHIPYKSLACPVHMRALRDRSIGWLWYILDSFAPEATGTACLIPTGLIVPADELDRFEPAKAMKRLRNDFDRCGVTEASGIIFAGLDAEFCSTRSVYHFHYHLAGAGEKIDALEGLRDKPKYDSKRREGLEGRPANFPRVQVKRGPFNNQPSSFTYTMKGYIPDHPLFRLSDGTWERSAKNRAIPDPHHARWLLFRDRWEIGDFVMLSGMITTKTGFQITSRTGK